MARLSSTLIAFTLCALAQMSNAVTWAVSPFALPGSCLGLTTSLQPKQFATVNALPNGVVTYFPSNGTIQQIQTVSKPNNPSGYNNWNNTGTLAQFGVTNVSPSSAIAGIGYFSPQSGALIQRIFYQTTNGDIRSAFHSGINGQPSFVLDPTIIASGVPLGSPISAMQQANAPGLGQPVSHFSCSAV